MFSPGTRGRGDASTASRFTQILKVLDELPVSGIMSPMKDSLAPQLFELLDYAYIGARYDMHYKITKQQLEQLASCVKKLHEVTERICKEKIESFIP